MTPVVPTWIFYVISFIANLSLVLNILAIALIIAMFFIVIINFSDIIDAFDATPKGFKRWLITIVVIMLLGCAIPSKETMYIMLANTFITPDNIETVNYEAKELVDYVFEKIGELNQEE